MDNTQINTDCEQIYEARLAFVRNYLSRGDDASTRPDTGDVDTGRGCGRMVDVGNVGFGGTGMIQLKELRTPKTPEVPASAAIRCVCRRAGCVCCRVPK